MELSFSRHELANGLRVVLHPDPADPLVAVHLAYHVGSGREEPGRSGFAHLFEHMLFQGSQHVPKGAHFGLVQEAGGTLNGSTNQDLTRYWEKLPQNRLDLALWLESDRMGFLLPAMNQEKLDNQRDVVKNERRQSYEERPYGRTYETLLAQLYPEGHPYHHPTIGSMADIDAATLEDVRRFFERWYGPNNAVLVLAGDFDAAEALARVEHWFGDLAPVPPPAPPELRPAPAPPGAGAEPRVLSDEVSQPQLTLAWPAVHRGHPDRPALALLVEVLSAHRAARIDRALTLEERLASHVTMGLVAQERAGHVTLTLRPHEGVGLERLAGRVRDLLEDFAEQGPGEEELARRKARAEGGLLRGLEALERRAAVLAEATLLDGDPGDFARGMERFREVSPEDVRRVCARYLVEGPSVAVETVPPSAGTRPTSGWRGAGRGRGTPADEARRDAAPAAARPPRFEPPAVWRGALATGTPVAGTPYASVPLDLVRAAFPAGRVTDEPGRAGRAVLCAALLRSGTRERDVLAWTEALDAHGAILSVSAGDEDLVFELRAPTAHLAGAVELLAETVFTPRFAPEDFERRRAEHAVHLATRRDRPRELADDLFRRLLRGPDDPLGRPQAGETTTLAALDAEELRAHWERILSTHAPRLSFVGEPTEAEALGLLSSLAALDAPCSDAVPPPPPVPAPAAAPGIYLLDRPGATQCELRVGHRGPALHDPDFHPLQALNAVLGGTFSSRLNLNLRERRGITYGVRSLFHGGLAAGHFLVATAVDTDHAALAVEEIRREIAGLLDGVGEEEVDFVRAALTRRLVSTYASLGARAARLDNVLKYGFPPDYPSRRLAWLEGMERAQLDELARRHLRPAELVCVVVGDAARIEASLAAQGSLVRVGPELAPDLLPV